MSQINPSFFKDARIAARYLVYPKPLLGPCCCQSCGEPLWWAKRPTRYLGNLTARVGWREEDGALHRCSNVAVVKRKASKSQIRQESFHHHAAAS